MLQTNVIPVDLSSALGKENECAERMQLACERAGIPHEFPMPTENAAAVLRDGLFYDCDTEWLRNLVSSGNVAVDGESGRLTWSALDISTAGCLCEMFRRFQFCPAHEHKFTPWELLSAQAEAAGEPSPFADSEQVASRDLLAMISQSQDPSVRGVLAVALLAKLKAWGVADK